MSSYWANFIKSGDPNGEGLPFWPSANENYGYMELGEELKAHEGMEGRLDELIHEFVQREYKLTF